MATRGDSWHRGAQRYGIPCKASDSASLAPAQQEPSNHCAAQLLQSIPIRVSCKS